MEPRLPPMRPDSMTAMLTQTFNRLFHVLVSRWKAYQQAPRDPARVVELAAARAALDDARAAISTARGRLEPQPAPEGRYVWRSAVDPDTYRLLKLRGVFPEG